jgi:cytochrome b
MNTTLTHDDPPLAVSSAIPAARVRVWDLPVRVFHWALAGSFAAAYVLAESERLRQVHVMLGYTVLGLIAFRMLWGFVGTQYARFASFLFGPGAVLRYLGHLATGRPEHHLGHNPAGSWAIWAILALGVATGVTGYMTFNELGGEVVEELHEGFANAWLAVVFVHVAGVLVSSVLHRENLVTAMVTGYKRAVGGSPVADVPARRLVGLAGALAIGAFWIGSLLTGAPSGAGAADAADTPDSRQAAMAEVDEDDDD